MIYFISGIDTDIGKSFATGLLARWLLARGKRVTTLKPVQTGNVGGSEDIRLHRELMGASELPGDAEGLSCPYLFRKPCSPHLAAELEGRRIDPAVIDQAAAQLAERYEYVLIEGAGGLGVPLTPELLTVDYLAERAYPVILTTSGRLGAINHTMLALEALARRQIRLSGLLFNTFPPADPVLADDARRIMRLLLRRYDYPEVLIDLPAVKKNEPPPLPDFAPLFSKEEESE